MILLHLFIYKYIYVCVLERKKRAVYVWWVEEGGGYIE